MEHTFRCNVLKCRRELVGQALVTICSHIFCADCARRQGLYPGSESSKRCPACGTELRKPDDIVLATLSLGEEYKTSVLSGLSPHVIMECVGRGLSFWAYQMIQEDAYQRYLVKSVTGKLQELNQQYQKTVNNANLEISDLREKLQSQGANYSRLLQKHADLGLAYKEKCRMLTQVQELYDKVKRKAELGQMEAAAFHAVDSNFRLNLRLPEARAPRTTIRHGIYEQQAQPSHTDTGPAIDDHQIEPNRESRRVLLDSKLPLSFHDEEGWPKARPALIPQTPRSTQGHYQTCGVAGHVLPMASEFNTGTPSTRGLGGYQNGYITRKSPMTRGRGLGVGLSSGIKTSKIVQDATEPGNVQSQSQGVAQRPVMIPPAYGTMPNA